jgi:hypothetical protein
VASSSTAKLPGHSSDGVRSMDHMEASVLGVSQRNFGSHRVRVHGAVRKSRDHLHIVRASAIIGVFSASTGVVIAIIAAGGHW